jgi:hypothetical protein
MRSDVLADVKNPSKKTVPFDPHKHWVAPRPRQVLGMCSFLTTCRYEGHPPTIPFAGHELHRFKTTRELRAVKPPFAFVAP